MYYVMLGLGGWFIASLLVGLFAGACIRLGRTQNASIAFAYAPFASVAIGRPVVSSSAWTPGVTAEPDWAPYSVRC